MSHWLASKLPVLFRMHDDAYGDLINRIKASAGDRSNPVILEIGGIDRPLLDCSPAYQFFGLDLEKTAKCDEMYDRFFEQSVCDPIRVESEIIFSNCVLEHVPDCAAALGSMFDSLVPGGEVHHYLPSMYHPYAVGLRNISNTMQKGLIKYLRPELRETTGYPVYFDHCTPRAFQRLMSRVGFTEIRITPYYRATDYFSGLFPLFFLMALFETVCETLKVRQCCAGFVVSAKKPIAE